LKATDARKKSLAGGREAGGVNLEAGVTGLETVVGGREPGGIGLETVVGGREPGVTGLEAVVGGREDGGVNLEAGVTGLEAVVGGREPGVTGLEAVVGGREDGGGDRARPTGAKPPDAGKAAGAGTAKAHSQKNPPAFKAAPAARATASSRMPRAAVIGAVITRAELASVKIPVAEAPAARFPRAGAARAGSAAKDAAGAPEAVNGSPGQSPRNPRPAAPCADPPRAAGAMVTGGPGPVLSRSGGVRIIGIDPGSLHTGYGVLECQGQSISILAFGRISPAASLPFSERLKRIFEGLGEILDSYGPQACSLEDVFTYKNPRSAFKLAQARGAAITAVALKGLPVFEYSPTLVKSSVCGSGRADKAQVAFMVSRTLGLAEEAPPDATDALAVAMCHAAQAGARLACAGAPLMRAARARSSSWKSLAPEDLAAMGFRVGEPK
jgi:crossover junction endodeoxyribonuclease RuvC